MMKFIAFHLMPYAEPEVLEAVEQMQEPRTAWVHLSNELYDPRKGAALYARYLDELCFAEEVGFDGVAVNEHHQTAYGTMPSPNVMAAALSQRTRSAQIAILGNALSLHAQPQRVAEQVAMLDLLSEGRVICGFVRGIGFESTSLQANPTESRERFSEAHDLIVRSWTTPGPFSWHSEHYHFDYVNPWPRPLQQPHPPIWIPSQGSSETVAWTAQRRYTYAQTFTALPRIAAIMEEFREAAKGCGYAATPDQLAWAFIVNVAETDDAAREELRPHVETLFNRLILGPIQLWFPPGYQTEGSHQRVVTSKSGLLTREDITIEELEEAGVVITGSPDTVAAKLRRGVDATGVGTLVPMVQVASMPHEAAMRNVELFGAAVIPRLRGHRSAVYA
jgi:alkanesulfonate monooxygenase SsuD/methylene tetrahydromethanopterin reductase-like flavin-dependent oxidoreductase (luciferase family)